jgi:microcystin-dependent protein
MSEPFVGEIRMFAGNFAPRGWALCDGQLLAVSQNDALFSLFGTTYGGDGRTTFGLPDVRGRVPIHAGSGPGLSPRRLGAKAGAENVTLATSQLPSHTHEMSASNESADSTIGTAKVLAKVTGGNLYRGNGNQQSMNAEAISTVGGNLSHSNLMPFLCINYIVSLFGIYPSRH